MFREMRRKKQQLSADEVDEILKKHNTCTLALSGDDGYPYSLPIATLTLTTKYIFTVQKQVTKSMP